MQKEKGLAYEIRSLLKKIERSLFIIKVMIWETRLDS